MINVDIYKGLFYAPAAGDYYFYLSGDDVIYLKLDLTTPFSSDTDTYDPETIAYTDDWTNH